MLQPKRLKYRRQQKGRNKGIANRGFTIAFGTFGLKSLENARITDRQIEAARVAMTRHMKREGNVWIRIFPDRPVTAKPAEVRMGKGKGTLDHYVAMVKPGTIMFEMEGVPYDIAVEAFHLAAQKLPVATKMIIRPTAPEAINIQ
ncbi:MAG: 50S ribosomal protein L16 [Saprospiraceae bacterium]